MAHLDALSRTGPAATGGAYLPGLILVAVVTAAAYGLHAIPALSVLSPMIISIMIGMLLANSGGVPDVARPGIGLCGKRLLRASVALLGLQLTFAQIGQIGLVGVVAAALALGSTFVFTLWLGRLLRVDRALTYLLAGGVSICGASAIAAVGAVVKAEDEDVSYAIACITIFGTAAMFAYPILKSGLGLDAYAYGQWVGLSVHEVAQVVGASFQGGVRDGEIAVVTKLTRVMMLAPMIVAISLFAASRLRRGDSRARAGSLVPTFILVFAAFVIANSLDVIPEAIRSIAVAITPILLSAALGALGLGTHFRQVRARGIQPLALAGASTLFIAGVSLLFVKVTV